jgi:hypothetical protein
MELETLEEAFEKWAKQQSEKGVVYDNIDVLRFGAEWQAERMYDEEEKELIVTKTIAGYEVTNFEKLEIPFEIYGSEPHIYGGNVELPNSDGNHRNHITNKFYCTWDKFGKCANWQKTDYFINVNN